MTDSRITVKFSFEPMKHVADVGCTGRIGEDRLFDLLCCETVSDCQSKQIDYHVSVRTNQMSAEDAPAVSFDQCFVSVDRLGNPARRHQFDTFCRLTLNLKPVASACASPKPTLAIGGRVKATLGTSIVDGAVNRAVPWKTSMPRSA